MTKKIFRVMCGMQEKACEEVTQIIKLRVLNSKCHFQIPLMRHTTDNGVIQTTTTKKVRKEFRHWTKKFLNIFNRF